MFYYCVLFTLLFMLLRTNAFGPEGNVMFEGFGQFQMKWCL